MSGTDDAPVGPDDDVAVGEIVDDDPTDDLSTDAAAARLRDDLDRTVRNADELGQTAEEAVAEAVDVAQRLQVERDELRDLVQRVQADFENYKRRVETQRAEQRAQAALDLVRELLPVLDACDAALAQGHDDVAPVQIQLAATLEKQGLARVDSVRGGVRPERARGRHARGGRRRGRRGGGPAGRLRVEPACGPTGHGQGQGLTGSAHVHRPA